MLDFLYTAVSWVLLRWHSFFTLIGVPENSGWNWALSIVFLTISARLLLFRFFVKQVHSQRKMAEMQPRMQAIRAKYKDDKQAQQREMMKLQQEEGFNPISGCLPVLLQFPIFISLFHVLRHLARSSVHAEIFLTNPSALTAAGLRQLSLYGFTPAETASAARAKLWNAPLAASFNDPAAVIHSMGGTVLSTRLVILPLLIVSALATMATQLLVKRNQTVVPEGTAATIQKLTLYIFPIGVLASGLIFNFPLGVLIYWFTSNLWTLGQQAYIIRFHPPETAAVGAGAATATAKALAPKPGAKPNYAKVRPANETPAADVDKSTNGLSDESTSTSTSPPHTPRPGARPTKTSGNRPAKRPNQAKKRR